MSSVLDVFSDLSEQLNYNLTGFPLYVRKGTLLQFARYAAACHWHPDLEFILVLEGSMEYFVNRQIVRIGMSEGIFVNSKRLHYGFSTDKTNCSFIVVAVHPSLLGEDTHTGKIYLEEKFGSNTDDFVLLQPQIPWQREILLLLNQMYNEMYSSTCNPLRLLSQAVSLCASIGEYILPVSGQITDNQSLMTVWKMTGFIHKQYGLKITLDNIAAAGNVCRSKCCELFRRYVGQTPNTYLLLYRIQKSCEMLCETNMPISEIALTCGFQSPGYFSYVFHKARGSIPRDYRKLIVGS